MIKYFRRNYLAYVLIFLLIVTLSFFVLPAVKVGVNTLHYQTSIGGTPTEFQLDGAQSYTYNVWQILAGSVENLKVLRNSSPDTIKIVFYVPINVWLGFGLILLVAAVVLMAFDNRVIRIVGASISLVGTLFSSLFLFLQHLAAGYKLPILPDSANVYLKEHPEEFVHFKEFQPGIFIALTLIILVGVGCILLCVYDNYKRYKFQKEEEARYLRGGI